MSDNQNNIYSESLSPKNNPVNTNNGKNVSHQSLQRLKFNTYNGPAFSSYGSSGSLSPHSPSFNDLNRLSIYRNQSTNNKNVLSKDPSSPNIYTSMHDIKKLENKPPEDDFLTSKPMQQSSSYSYAQDNRKKSKNKNNMYKLRPIKERDYHHHKKPDISINDGHSKLFTTNDNSHYKKVSEITLMEKSFSDILFKKHTEKAAAIEPIDPVENIDSPTEEQGGPSKYIYGTAKEHGFGSNLTKEPLSTKEAELFPMSSSRTSLPIEHAVHTLPENENDQQPKNDSEISVLLPNDFNISSSASEGPKMMKNEDSSSISLPGLLATKSDDMKIKNLVSDEFLSNDVLLNSIKETLIKQLQLNHELSLKDLGILNKKEKGDDVLTQIEKIINDFYITKQISSILKKLNTNAVLFNKQVKKINELGIWERESEGKINQLRTLVKQLYDDQLSQNLKQLLQIKEQMETKFNYNMQKNTILTKQHAEIVENYNELKSEKLTKLENWNKSIIKMEKYHQEKSCKFLSLYDIIFIVVVSVIVFYHYRKKEVS